MQPELRVGDLETEGSKMRSKLHTVDLRATRKRPFSVQHFSGGCQSGPVAVLSSSTKAALFFT